jgi:predicted dehydrogenase
MAHLYDKQAPVFTRNTDKTVVKKGTSIMSTNQAEPVTALMIGAGGRGMYAYGPYALQNPAELRIVAVAEPDHERRARFVQAHSIPAERQFKTWQDALAQPQLARAAINCTQDQMHYDSTLGLLRAGYDVLLEKPIAPTKAECVTLVQTAESLGRVMQICHVLRFTAFFSALYDVVQSGRLGRIITVDHRENVSYWHMSHSFVRGHWRNETLSSPMILAKCCHDLDVLAWITGQPAAHLSSFGTLTHYRAENAPQGAPPRCTDGCPVEASCPWYAPKLYGALEGVPPRSEWIVTALGGGDTPAERWRKLESSPYGRCVYHCDNDVVDHQVINLEYPDGLTVTFSMHGHSDTEGRTMRWDGTRATLYGDFSDGRPHELRIHDHGSNSVEVIHPQAGDSGHGGGDAGLLHAFISTLRGQPVPHQTSARASLESHLMAFAAEESRHTRRSIDLNAYRQG